MVPDMSRFLLIGQLKRTGAATRPPTCRGPVNYAYYIVGIIPPDEIIESLPNGYEA